MIVLSPPSRPENQRSCLEKPPVRSANRQPELDMLTHALPGSISALQYGQFIGKKDWAGEVADAVLSEASQLRTKLCCIRVSSLALSPRRSRSKFVAVAY